MGHSQSAQYNDLVKPYNPFDWRQIQHHHGYQIWQSISNGKRQAVYPIELTQPDSESNIQIYHFRKLNHMHLVTVQAILKNNADSFCGDPKSLKLLIENIPVRLAQINKKIGFIDRLSILSTTFAALHTINYLYGPLYVTEHMIGFAQNGKPKVWINEDFSKNEPSRSAKGQITQNSAIQQLELLENEMLVAQEMLNCVTQVFKTAGNSDVETYPIDFRIEAANVRTFAEGEELIQNYCRNRNIELKENIPFWDYIKDTDSQCQGSHIQSELSMLQNTNRPSNNLLHIQGLSLKQLATQRPKRESMYANMDQSTTRAYPPRVLFSSGCNGSNTRIVINYGGQTLRRSDNQRVNTSFMAPQLVVSKVNHIPPPAINQTGHTQAVEYALNQQKQVENKDFIAQPIQPVVSQQIIKEQISKPLPHPPQIYANYKKQHIKPPFKVAQSLEELSFQHSETAPKEQRSSQQHIEEPKNTKKLSLQQNIIKQSLQQNPKKQKIQQIVMPKIISQYYMSESQAENSSNFTGFNTIDEIKLWEASLLMKISSKQAAQDQKVPPVAQYEPEGYQSCQSQDDSQQVRFGGEESGSIQNLKDMEAYIRNKYKDYLTNSNQNAADSQSDSNGGNDKFYSFGLKPGKLLRGRENSLTNLKPNVFKRRPSINDNVPIIEAKAVSFKDNLTGFMSKAKKLGIDSQSKIIYEQSARQSGRESQSEMRYTTFGKIEQKGQVSPYSVPVKQPSYEPSSAKSRREYTSSYGKLQDRYNKYVTNRSNNRIGSNKNNSLNLIQTQTGIPNARKPRERAAYFIDTVNESRSSQQSIHRNESKYVNDLTTPKKSVRGVQESMPGQLTYDNLRDFLRK